MKATVPGTDHGLHKILKKTGFTAFKETNQESFERHSKLFKKLCSRFFSDFMMR